jgi:hypothetical protein
MSNKVVPGNDQPGHRKPKDTPFRQQTMKAYKPVPTVKSAAIIFTVLGIIFIIVGSVLLAKSQEIIEIKVRYDDCPINNSTTTAHCQKKLTVDKKMTQPVYFYYQLNNFYQNHRRYVKSKSASQLAGQKLSIGDVSSDCDPIITMKDLGLPISPSWSAALSASASNSNVVANPCGLIAKTFFNDSYSLAPVGSSSNVPINETDIAWPSDKEKKFKRLNVPNWKDYQWTDVENGKS